MILDLEAPVNKSHIGLVLGKSQQAVSKLALKIADNSIKTNGQLITAIFERLTDEAAGRGGDAQGDLVLARIRETNASADLKELLAKEKAGEVVFTNEVEPQLLAMVTAARQELLSLPEKLANDVKALHGIEIDVSLIQDRINDALKQLATSLHGNDADHDVESG